MLKTILVILALAYIAFPRDLLPDWLVGFGWIDDLFVLYLLWRYFFRFAGSAGTGGRRERRAGNGPAKRSGQVPGKTPYEILEIEPDASISEIRHAYRALANKYHPDKTAHLGPDFQALSEEKFKEIQEAYDWLTEKKGKS